MTLDPVAVSFLRPLRGLAEEQIRDFLNVCVPLTVAPETPLIHEGERDRTMIFVLSGMLEVSRGLEGAMTPLRRYGRGEQLGELALMGLVQRRTASVRALTEAELLILEASGMEQLRSDGNPAVDRIEAEALRALARRLREVDARIAALAHGDDHMPEPAPTWSRLLDAIGGANSHRRHPPGAVEVLERSTHFQRSSAAWRQHLAGLLEPQAFAAGEAVVEEGDMGGDAWIVASGEVGAWRITAQHRHERLATLPPGTLFGHVSIVDGDARTATCLAESPAWLYRMPRELCMQQMNDVSPEARTLRRGFMDALTRQLQLANEHLTQLSMQQTLREADGSHPGA